MHARVLRSLFSLALACSVVVPQGAAFSGTNYPSEPQVVKDGATVWLVDYAHAPFSSRTTSGNYPPPINYNDQLSRLNFMRSEPTNAPGFG